MDVGEGDIRMKIASSSLSTYCASTSTDISPDADFLSPERFQTALWLGHSGSMFLV